MAQFGSALDWGSRGRWFESSRSDHCLVKKKGVFSPLFCVFKNQDENFFNVLLCLIPWPINKTDRVLIFPLAVTAAGD